MDTWFICNLQPQSQQTEVILNTTERFPQVWNPMTGEARLAARSRVTPDGRLALAVKLQPWESFFVLLTAKPPAPAIRPARNLSPGQSYPVTGTWRVAFSGLGGLRAEKEMPTLRDWTSLPELRNFSGKADYTLEVQVPASFTNRGSVVFLDLGQVHEVAQVRVNGTDAGKVWMHPYQVEVTGMLNPGNNRIEVTVANLLWNYAAGLNKPTPIPQDLQGHYGATWKPGYNGWGSLQAAKRANKNDRLPSGLLGPVTLRTATAKAED